MHRSIERQTCPWLRASVLTCALVAACSAPSPEEAHFPAAPEIGPASLDQPEEPKLIFINLLPWGEIDFSRGDFLSLDTCTQLVRSLPNYSGYTTAERCEPITDPIYCSVWQDKDDRYDQIGCFKGVGGCEVELRRHDLLAESGNRTIITRCEPYSLGDAWARFQTDESTVTPSPSLP